MSMRRGYIFDYGGTLDTGGNHWGKVFWHAYQHAGVPVSEQQFRDSYVYAERYLGQHHVIGPEYTFRQTLAEKLRLQGTVLGCERFRDELLTSLMALACRHTADSLKVLLWLKERYPLVLVSNFYGNLSTVLREFRLDGVFSRVVESAAVGVCKPDPRIFTLGVEALGMEPGAVTVVGDSMDKDIVPAKQAGCRTVWLKGEQWTDDPVDESVPDRIITRIEELKVTEN